MGGREQSGAFETEGGVLKIEGCGGPRRTMVKVFERGVMLVSI